MKVFANRVLRRIFRPERDEIVEAGSQYEGYEKFYLLGYITPCSPLKVK
jgi:hypothetical protein